MLTRRGLLTGLAAACAAPAIVHAASLMPVRTMLWTPSGILEVALLDQLNDVIGRAFVEDVLLPSVYIPINRTGVIQNIRVSRGGQELWRSNAKNMPVCQSMTARITFSNMGLG